MAKLVSLAPKLDTAASVELRKTLLSAGDEDIVFDGAKVEMLGALCTELLMMAGSLWKKAGHDISLKDPSPRMCEDLRRFGLTPENLLEYAA